MFKYRDHRTRARRALVAVAPLLALPTAYAQGEGEGIVTIGTEATPSHATGASTGTLNAGADAWVAFDQAINGAAYLGGNGGTVVVLPGVYEFQSAVVVPTGVTIEGSRGAILKPAPQTTEPMGETAGIFDVQGDGFVLNGLSIELPEAGDYVDDQAAVCIGPGVKNTIIRNCVFVVKHERNAQSPPFFYRDYSFIRAGDASGEPFDNLILHANNFQFSPYPNQNTEDLLALPFLPVEVRNGRGFILSGNSFKNEEGVIWQDADKPEPQAWIRHCVLVSDVRSVIVGTNTFSNLGRLGPEGAENLGMVEYLVRVESSTVAGGAIAMRDNYVEDITSITCFDIDTPQAFTFSGNGIGRAAGVLRLTGGGPASVPAQAVISGNQFHNTGPRARGPAAIGPTILVDGHDHVAITGNQFSLCVDTQITVVSGRVSVKQNHFISAPPKLADEQVGVAISFVSPLGKNFIMHNFTVIGAGTYTRTWAGVHNDPGPGSFTFGSTHNNW